MIAALALLAGTAFAADDLDAWLTLYDGLLDEAADNDVDKAIRTYQALSRSLSSDAPLRGVALYWQGRALDSDDDIRGAREALRECARGGYPRALCLNLLGRIELEQTAVRVVPTVWRFDDSDHGFVHPWVYSDRGAIRTEDGTLAWRTRIKPEEDLLLVGFSQPTPAPRGVRFRTRSSLVDATLRVFLFDVSGRRYVARGDDAVHRVPRATWTTVDVPFSSLSDFDDGGVPLNRSNVDRLAIQDESGRFGAPIVSNEILIDDFEVY